MAGRETLGDPSPAWLLRGSLPTSLTPSVSWLQPGSRRRGSQGAFPPLSAQAEDSKEVSSPLGELQEAVEMLNSAVKERERVVEVAVETESLERLVGDRT